MKLNLRILRNYSLKKLSSNFVKIIKMHSIPKMIKDFRILFRIIFLSCIILQLHFQTSSLTALHYFAFIFYCLKIIFTIKEKVKTMIIIIDETKTAPTSISVYVITALRTSAFVFVLNWSIRNLIFSVTA